MGPAAKEANILSLKNLPRTQLFAGSGVPIVGGLGNTRKIKYLVDGGI
jgi:hypothetical protein